MTLRILLLVLRAGATREQRALVVSAYLYFAGDRRLRLPEGEPCR